MAQISRTTDNNQGKKITDIFKGSDHTKCASDLALIAGIPVSTLVEKNDSLLVFPAVVNEYGDDIGNSSVFSLSADKLTTYNLMGFIGCNQTELTIASRFYSKGNDYFLHYMLQKVFSINLFDLKHSTDKENLWDFLIYLLPFYLKKALSQGLFKQYQNQEYNNPSVKGAIDINRHIRSNIPFTGNIAFRTREHVYDNWMTQLIRHSIEYVLKHKRGASVLNADVETQTAITQIKLATPAYNERHRTRIIQMNLKPANHPFFTEYRVLQKICLQILRRDGLTYGEEKDKVYGLLFDGAWLWEEYLNTILKQINFVHPRNKGKSGDKNPIYLFNGNSYSRFPDFYCHSKKMVLDAKYKHLDNKKISREDIHQIVTYIHVLRSELGGFIYPIGTNGINEPVTIKTIGLLNGFGGRVISAGIPIYKQSKSFDDFASKMKITESCLVDEVINMTQRQLTSN
ncbi:5-methylcytosine-specific restriction endonuclease McrBC, regulatory subunit McrC [Draconibacterium orientale]|uniref:5-methylcytosine-specific restriction endonuclease McrBC, regulatory subunit McrC n=1 Tax=Draconibacterium orientale TaxID=1168034 RepID=X5DKH0_9BACT|nr:hypothetical protein [Draconibacterium orientale]AHW61047.1 hypothetical protein FH5T_19250 [Draconibacterium orientale]SET54864.1 5-methylcytosine-specific restriction endonuclease McrBC, regulatory subunit McrC [Draconibacterium orientale]